LCDVASPDYGYITNFGKAHLEGFGGIAELSKEKSEMYINLKLQDVGFVNSDDAIQVNKSKDMKVYSFGINNVNSDISSVTANPFVVVTYEFTTILSHLIGL
jgi:UDP-N-acetylmuramoyl-tripeptide--D-alanyl-D-alanine ligase